MVSLTQRLVLSFLAFVVAGSGVLVAWLNANERRESREVFATIARTNADFLRTQRLPLTERTAAALSEVLGVTVQFHRRSEKPAWIPGDRFTLAHPAKWPEIDAWEPVPGVTVLAEIWEVAAAEIQGGNTLVLVRRAERFGFLQPGTLAAVGVFGGLSLALAWVLAQGIVRPLRSLTKHLPLIAQSATAPELPGLRRQDEIGQLARSYTQTHAQLVSERHAREQAEKLATLGRMATGLAHEINNPVAAIKLHTQLLESELPAETHERLGIILAETARIESLVSQWMFLARPQPPQVTACELREIIDAAVASHTPAANHAGMRIVADIPAELRVQADRRRLAQAVANAITNAIHATAGRDGLLTISAELIAAEPGRVALRFQDNGPGFSATALARATELFYSEKEGGMGIGLNVTAGILQAHGGELRLTNAPTGGANVTFVLPVSPPLSS